MGGGALHTQREAPGFSPCGEGAALAAHAFVFERGELYPAGHAAGAEWAQDITGVDRSGAAGVHGAVVEYDRFRDYLDAAEAIDVDHEVTHDPLIAPLRH